MANNDSKKYISLSRLSNFLDNIKAKYSQIGHKHKISDLTDYTPITVDSSLSSTSTNPVQNKILNAEFDAIGDAMGALELAIDGKAESSHNHDDRYYTETEVDEKLEDKADKTHSHSLKDLSSDSTHRTVTDTEKSTWNAKSNFSGNYNDLTNKPTIPSIDGLATEVYVNDAVSDKVVKVTGKGLSTNDYTTAEKNKLAGIETGAQVNTITGVKGNSESAYRTGNVNITKANIGLGNVDNTADANKSVNHATSADSATKATQDGNGKVISSTYETKADATSKLTEAKTYADNAASKVKNDLLNGAGAAYDTLKELGELIDDNKDAIEALEAVASGKADKTHSHAISDVTNLQSALDGKAPTSHGTHVSYSTTAPVMDGTASVGSASTVARSDHKHPTDTSRAAKTDLDSHTGNTTVHITSTERTNWNAAKTHADSAHAPSNAQPNQNAFSNVKVGSTTIAADTTTDTLELVGSNVTITPDATNDKVTIAVASGSTSTAGIVKLTNSTSSTSTTTAATPSSVKSAYDLANNAYALADSKVAKLSDLGITASATELNYMNDTIGNIQTQLDERRTHWVECGSGVILSSRSLSNNATLSGLTSVTPPDCIVVTFDNVEYKCVKWTNGFGEKCYGDSRIAEATDMTNPENTPFYINACADDGADFNLVWTWYIMFNSNISNTSHTVKINEAEYHAISENFIPNAIARRSDVSQVQIITWEAND